MVIQFRCVVTFRLYDQIFNGFQLQEVFTTATYFMYSTHTVVKNFQKKELNIPQKDLSILTETKVE